MPRPVFHAATLCAVLFTLPAAAQTLESRIFRYGYGASTPLVTMQSAGTDAAGSGQGVLALSQQITHDGRGAPGAVATLHSALTMNGQPQTDYWAAGFSTYIQNLADPHPPAGGSQHGVLYTHLVKTTAAVPGGTVPPGRHVAEGWAQWWVLSDRTGLPSSRAGSIVGVELDIDGNGADDTADKSRYARQVVLTTFMKDPSRPFEFGYGDYWNSTTGGGGDSFFNVVSAYYAGWTVAAIDLSQGTGARANPYKDSTNRAVDIKMRNGGKLAFDGDGVNGSYLTHRPGGLEYWSEGNRRATITDAGALILGGAVLNAPGGSLALPRVGTPGPAPGAAGGRLELVCGTRPGTARLVVYAGTSTTPTTIADNIGGGVAGC